MSENTNIPASSLFAHCSTETGKRTDLTYEEILMNVFEEVKDFDCVWNQWSAWGTCSVTCGNGTQSRSRVTVAEKNGGKPCFGQGESTAPCYLSDCNKPGDWMAWGSWGYCSQSCNGTKMRARFCDMKSNGNFTLPCEGRSNETSECNNFPCSPLATCSDFVTQYKTVDSGEFQLSGGGVPFVAFCDTIAMGGVGVTIIGSDHDNWTHVNGYEGAGEYEQPIEYYKHENTKTRIGVSRLNALSKMSEGCRQKISWKCLRSGFVSDHDNATVNPSRVTYWQNADGENMYYWGDVKSPDFVGCACGETQSCSGGDGYTCNCDTNDGIWREDTGFLNFKDHLPVTLFLAGDTGSTEEEGYYIVGPLECWGRDPNYIPDY